MMLLFTAQSELASVGIHFVVVLDEALGYGHGAINQSINQSNVFRKLSLHQQMSQSAIQKPSLKPQTASNADVEAQ